MVMEMSACSMDRQFVLVSGVAFSIAICSSIMSGALSILILHGQSGNALITPSKAARATAFAGKARRKHGANPLQKPLSPYLA